MAAFRTSEASDSAVMAARRHLPMAAWRRAEAVAATRALRVIGRSLETQRERRGRTEGMPENGETHNSRCKVPHRAHG